MSSLVAMPSVETCALDLLADERDELLGVLAAAVEQVVDRLLRLLLLQLARLHEVLHDCLGALAASSRVKVTPASR